MYCRADFLNREHSVLLRMQNIYRLMNEKLSRTSSYLSLIWNDEIAVFEAREN